MDKRLIIFRWLSIVLLVILAAPTASGANTYEAYYLYWGEYPYAANPGWHEDVQGVTHDENNWYITQASEDESWRQALWKIPVGVNLFWAIPGVNGVERILITDIRAVDQEFANKGYWHFGDLSFYQHEGQGYLFVPFESWDNPYLCFAVFKTNPLRYLCHAPIDLRRQTHAAWVAVDPRPTTGGGGILYSSTENFTVINRFGVDWDALRTQGALHLTDLGGVSIKDESNSTLTIYSVQGGVFSEGGDLLYIVSGKYDRHVWNEGINVFDTHTWRRVALSTNGYGHFNYQFDPTCYFPDLECEEPEGITIWDLDDGKAPGIKGQLHVLLLDNDWPDDDDIYFKHYTHTIDVDSIGGNDSQWGRPFDPKKTVTGAYNLAWAGARIRVKAGTYPESLVIAKAIQIVAYAGTVKIGKVGQGGISLTPPATVAISSGGVLRLY